MMDIEITICVHIMGELVKLLESEMCMVGYK